MFLKADSVARMPATTIQAEMKKQEANSSMLP